MHHVEVYRGPDRFAGWPANYGIWSWGGEVVVGFTLGYHAEAEGLHAADRHNPWIPMQARSTDGGDTWEARRIPARTPGDRGLSADEHIAEAVADELRVGRALDGVNAPTDPPGGIDFEHPDFALMCARSGIAQHDAATSWFYASADRCRSWQGPYRLPAFGYDHVAARTDYVVESPGSCLLFLTVKDGPPTDVSDTEHTSEIHESDVLCVRTDDWGSSFECVGRVAEGAIMPASLAVGGRLLTAVRRDHIDLYASTDGGASWSHLATPALETGGNPPSLIELADGRLCLTYGYRKDPYGIRATLSADGGETWGDPVVLRDDGGHPDLGYPRSIQRPDGKVVTVYYFTGASDAERHVAATVWEP